MPNVLLFGGSPDLYEMFCGDTRWNTQRAVHSKSASLDKLGDPLRWQLIVHECGHATVPIGEEGASPDFARVPTAYLGEAERAHQIVIAAPPDEHMYIESIGQKGYHDLEFNRTDAPEASHLEDFVDTYQLAFARARLSLRGYASHLVSGATPLFEDKYGSPLIWLWGDDLHIIDIPDDAARLEAFKYLCYRTVPKLWPDVYSDEFRPRRVLQLESEREKVVGEFRIRQAEIDKEIDEELGFYAPYTSLTQLADEPLKVLVKKALEDVFNLGVIDLDDELKEDEAKTLDLLVSCPSWTGFVEVRSSSNRGAQVSWMERFDDHVDAVTARHGPPDSKVFIFNGMYWREPDQRTDQFLFNQPVIDEAHERGITLLSTARFLEAIEARRNDEITDTQFVDMLKIPGVFQPLA